MIKIDHVAVYVKDLEKTKDFFIDYLNAVPNEMYHNPRTGLRTYFLNFGSDTRLEIMTRPDLASTEWNEHNCGLTHLSFSLGSRDAVNALTSRLADDGYTVLSGPRVTGDGYYESSIKAIENLILELTE